MTDETGTKRGPGRPKGSVTGQKPLRTARIGAVWERGQKLDAELAELQGEKPNMTAYVEAALFEYNAQMERAVAKLRAQQASS